MGENAADSVFSGKFQKCGNILRVNIPGVSAPGIAGKELERIGIYFNSILSHGEVAAGRGKMTSDGKHDDESPFPMIFM